MNKELSDVQMSTNTEPVIIPQESSSRIKESSISWRESLRDWWTSSPGLLSSEASKKAMHSKNINVEYELLRAMLTEDIYIKKPAGSAQENSNECEADETPSEESESTKSLIGELLNTEVESGVFIHEFYLENNEKDVPPEDQTHIVIIHGYMAALGYFFKNIEPILKSRAGIRLHVIDLVGFGNSSRPKFPKELLKKIDDKEEEITQLLAVENWFIDKIETWRKKRNLRRFHLIAHSMGAYLSCCYLMKYDRQYQKIDDTEPLIVDHFIAVSPMGTESNYISLLNQKKYQSNYHELGGDPFKELVTEQGDENEDELVQVWNALGQPKFPKNAILRKLWEYNVSPFQVLQKLGPFYSKILSLWSFNRFRNVKSETGEQSIDLIIKLHNYSYAIFNQYQGSGELAITKLINHEILPKMPICDRKFPEFVKESKLKVLWLYGDKDWMNINGGKHVHEKILNCRNNDDDDDDDDDDDGTIPLSRFDVIEDAGHHIYLDNASDFNRSCLDFFGFQS